MSGLNAAAPLAAWLAHLEALHPKGQAGIELGLERVARVKARLGHVENMPVILVAGTNGKGSTCAYLETILDRAGVKVGCYSSPHLFAYNERVRIGTQPVADAVLTAAFAKVEAARGDEALTYFEFGTLAAWQCFADAGCEAVVLEVGLGGRLDATNIYEPDVSIVTGIALDHQDFLGPTREHIGLEKAGVYRAGKPALCADPKPPQSLLDHAVAIGADLRLIGRDFGAERIPEDRAMWRCWVRQGDNVQRRALAYPALRGHVQIQNAAAAVAALDCLRDRLPISMQAIRRGLLEVELPGRFQLMPGKPALVFDVAHNPQATAVLDDNLSNMGFYDRTYAIVGMLADKDMAGALQPLLHRVDHWLCVPLDSPRAATPESLAAHLQKLQPDADVRTFESVDAACAHAAKVVRETDRIAVFGSFLTVAAVFPFRDRLQPC